MDYCDLLFDEFFDFLGASRLLLAKLIARKSEYVKVVAESIFKLL